MKKLFVVVALVMGLGTSVAFGRKLPRKCRQCEHCKWVQTHRSKKIFHRQFWMHKRLCWIYHQRSIRRRSGRNKTWPKQFWRTQKTTQPPCYTLKRVKHWNKHSLRLTGMCQVRHVPVFYFSTIWAKNPDSNEPGFFRGAWDSNPWPHAWQACILTNWTNAPLSFSFVVFSRLRFAKVGVFFLNLQTFWMFFSNFFSIKS